MKDTAVIILAAGKSTRMKSDLPKVLHPLCGRPVLSYVMDMVKALRVDTAVAVLGYRHEDVRGVLPAGTAVALQKRLIGTADAVKSAMPRLKGHTGTVLVLYGDTPLLTRETISRLLKAHREQNNDITLLTAHLEKPSGYGRIERDKYNSVSGIIEEKDASDFQKGIKEVNTGIMCFKARSLAWALKRIRPNNAKKEYYLTDAIAIMRKAGGFVDALKVDDINEVLGINSRAELAKAQAITQSRIHNALMQSGVTIVHPSSTVINHGVKVGRDTTIYPFTVIESDVTIGKRCHIGPFAHLKAGVRVSDDRRVGRS